MKIKKVLVLGSGALKIGEAGEFDYSGSQAIKALKEEGIKTVLVNPNIATVQTSEFLADKIYFLPVTSYFVEKVIQKEKPDSVFLSFGGQTALNCGLDLHKKGILKKYKVEILGSPIEAIEISEDRDKFAKHLKKHGFSLPESGAARTLSRAKEIAEKIGFPVMVRAAFALGGQKSGIAKNQSELARIVLEALSFSPQVLIERYLYHFKEIEYEVVRDSFDNCITICNMENMDPLGIHTGESIVVAPSQTLSNFEYHSLRKISIEVIRSLNIVGEANIQFALNPHPADGKMEYYIIEVNARLSRSSALASKATGYPIAYIAAKIALGKTLNELSNKVTSVTKSFFEPALDYLAVKIPRWDLEKFEGADEVIGSSMKSVGEVMAIGRTFEEALQKAVRMLDIGLNGVTDGNFFKNKKEIKRYLEVPTPKRLFAIAKALRENFSIEKIYKLTGINSWFLERIKKIIAKEKTLKESKKLNFKLLLELKQLGFSDNRIASIIGKKENKIRNQRKKLNIRPSVFQIDTLAGEAPAVTNYLYLTYNGFHDDVEPLDKDGVLILGGGPYRIGSSVEFDWTCVNSAQSFKDYGKKSIIINCNPETVSTDYDISDRLYFEELSLERVMDIYEFEKPFGVVVSVGGQTPNNLAKSLDHANVNILGTKAKDIDRAEDRNKFSKLLDKLGIKQPAWDRFRSISKAISFADKVGYPVLVRPSYVLSGSAMNVCYSHNDLERFVKKAVVLNKDYDVTISKFIQDSQEVEFDAVAQNGKIVCFAISKHIENAGVHSGDASIVYPVKDIPDYFEKEIIEIGKKLAFALNITGPFNIQFILNGRKIFVIETNLRASRTFPFISKATGVNFAKLLVGAFFQKNKQIRIKKPSDYVLKAPQFSFARITGADPMLRVEMSSTGEVACFGESIEEAFLKAELATGGYLPQKGTFISLGGDDTKNKFEKAISYLKKIRLPIFATEKTALFLQRQGINAQRLYKIHDHKFPTIIDYIKRKKIDLVINIVDPAFRKDLSDDILIRRFALDNNIYLLTNLEKSVLFIKCLSGGKLSDLKIEPWGRIQTCLPVERRQRLCRRRAGRIQN